MDDIGGVVCIAALLVLVGTVFVVVIWRRAAEISDELRDLRRRLVALESRRETPDAAAPPRAEAPAPHPVATRPPPAPWVETRPPVAEGPPPLPAEAAPPVAAPPARPAPSPSATAPMTFETFLGGRVMLVVGVIAVLFGIGFFLKYAIERDWIGPETRVTMGALAGVAMLVAGDRLRARGFDVYGHALMGCGLGALYLTNYFARERYHLYDRTPAMAISGALSVGGAALAVARRAPLLAYLGFAGGWLAPLLYGRHGSPLWTLTAWLSFIDAGALFVSLRRPWRGFALMSLVFTAGYLIARLLRLDGRSFDAVSDFANVGARYAVLLVLALVPAMARRERPGGLNVAVVLSATALFTLAAFAILFPAERHLVGAALLGAGLAVGLSGWRVGRVAENARGQSETLLAVATLLAGVSLTAFARGSAVSPALSAAGLAMAFAGTRAKSHGVVVGGLLTIALAFCDAVGTRTPMFEASLPLFWNERLLVFAAPCVAMLVAGRVLARTTGTDDTMVVVVGAAGLLPLAVVLAAEAGFGIGRADDLHRELQFVVPAVLLAAYAAIASRWFGRGSNFGRAVALVPLVMTALFGLTLLAAGHRRPFDVLVNPTFAAGLAIVAACWFAGLASETGVRAAFRVVGLVYLFALLTAELDAWGAHRVLDGITREEARFAARVWISVAWALYAAALVGCGFWKQRPVLRWLGLGVFALTVGKVFLIDLASLETVYRIGSFLALGALLVAASFLYQRARKPGGDAPGG